MNVMLLIDLSAYALLTVAMLYLAVKDIRERRVPNTAILALSGMWIAWRSVAALIQPEFATEILTQSATNLGSALLTFIALFSFGALYERIRRKPAMGIGDVKLISILLLYIGIRGIGLCLIIACMVGIVYAIAATVKKDPINRGIPFAACLACGMFVTFLLS